MVAGLAKFLFELGSEMWTEYRLAKRKQKEADAWAATPNAIRACFKCKEIAYTPGQVTCAKCGALL